MQSELLRFNTDQKYIIFDFETCNINLLYTENKPWQLGILIAHGKRVVSIDVFYIKWNPLNISKRAAEITRFDWSTYNKLAQDPATVLTKFESFLYNPEYLIVGHNILGFDVYIHNIYRRLLGLYPNYDYIDRCIDTHLLAKSIKLNLKKRPHEDLLQFQYGIQSIFAKGVKTNLQALGKEFNIDFDPETLHDAGNDIKLNWAVWLQLIQQVEI